MANIRDVARSAKVSVATVSHVINESRYVAPETKERVLKAVAQLKYQRDGIARSLRRNKTDTIGVIISDITNPFFADLVRGIEDAIYALDEPHNFILCNTEENDEKERLYLNILLEKRVEGLIVAPAGGNAQEFRRVLAMDVPLVFVDRTLPDVAADSICVDNREASRKAVEHLIETGHRRIAIVKALLNADAIEERVEGYREALDAAGIDRQSDLELACASSIDDARRACQKLCNLRRRPDAVFCTNNFVTLGVMQALAEAGLDCPRDIALVSFDDFPWATAFRPRLTAVSQPSYKMGREAVRLLFDRIAKAKVGNAVRVVLGTELIVRESSGADGL